MSSQESSWVSGNDRSTLDTIFNGVCTHIAKRKEDPINVKMQSIEERSKEGFRKVKMTMKQKSKKNSLPVFPIIHRQESRKGQFDEQRYNKGISTYCPSPSPSYLPPSTSSLSPSISILPLSTSIPPPSTSDMKEREPGFPVLDRIIENTPEQVLKVRLNFKIFQLYQFCLDVRVSG